MYLIFFYTKSKSQFYFYVYIADSIASLCCSVDVVSNIMVLE